MLTKTFDHDPTTSKCTKCATGRRTDLTCIPLHAVAPISLPIFTRLLLYRAVAAISQSLFTRLLLYRSLSSRGCFYIAAPFTRLLLYRGPLHTVAPIAPITRFLFTRLLLYRSTGELSRKSEFSIPSLDLIPSYAASASTNQGVSDLPGPTAYDVRQRNSCQDGAPHTSSRTRTAKVYDD
jgi:hypothetical protein